MADERLCTLLQLHLNSCHPVDFTFVVSEQKDERIVYVYSAIHGIQRNAKANCAKKGTIFRNSTDFFVILSYLAFVYIFLGTDSHILLHEMMTSLCRVRIILSISHTPYIEAHAQYKGCCCRPH